MKLRKIWSSFIAIILMALIAAPNAGAIQSCYSCDSSPNGGCVGHADMSNWGPRPGYENWGYGWTQCRSTLPPGGTGPTHCELDGWSCQYCDPETVSALCERPGLDSSLDADPGDRLLFEFARNRFLIDRIGDYFKASQGMTEGEYKEFVAALDERLGTDVYPEVVELRLKAYHAKFAELTGRPLSSPTAWPYFRYLAVDGLPLTPEVPVDANRQQ